MPEGSRVIWDNVGMEKWEAWQARPRNRLRGKEENVVEIAWGKCDKI